MHAFTDFWRDESGASLIDAGIALGAFSALAYVAVFKLYLRNADTLSWLSDLLPGSQPDAAGPEPLQDPDQMQWPPEANNHHPTSPDSPEAGVTQAAPPAPIPETPANTSSLTDSD